MTTLRRRTSSWTALAGLSAATALLLAPSAASADTFFVNNCLGGKVFDADSLCYDRCREGYSGVGPVCWASCPDGYKDDGALCRRDAHIISANNSSCPWSDVCGLTLSKGCSKCPSGYHNDGCTCRKDVHIVAKASYGRGAGETPYKSCTSNSFTHAVPTDNTPSSFTMLFMGDPQPPRSRTSGDDWTNARRVNREQVIAMNTITMANGGRWPSNAALTQGRGDAIQSPRGVVIAGDLTENWHEDELDHFMDFWGHSDQGAIGHPVFPGLGNHDYANNVGHDWWSKRGRAVDGNNGAAKNAVGFMKAMISCNMVPNFPASLVQSFDTDSLAYSWNIGRFHFVEMNNYPTYTQSVIGVSSALDWMKKDLAAANRAGKRSVLVFHDPSEHWASDLPTFHEAIRGLGVVGIFAAHHHGYIGRAGTDGPTDLDSMKKAGWANGYEVPIFFSGSPMYNTFTMVKFTDGYMNVASMDSTGGIPSFKCLGGPTCAQTVTF